MQGHAGLERQLGCLRGIRAVTDILNIFNFSYSIITFLVRFFRETAFFLFDLECFDFEVGLKLSSINALTQDLSLQRRHSLGLSYAPRPFA